MSDNAVEPRAVYLTRTIVGLLQGLALYLLYVAYDDRSWPATNGYVFAPILLTWSFAPVLALQGLSNLRTRTLLFWIAAAILVVVSLGFYDIWHAWPVETSPNVSAAARPTVLPSFQLAIVLILGFAIAHVLVSAADADRAFVAAYPTYFDVASKLAVQLALAVAFAGVFWGLLWLGAGLFELIKIRFVTDLIEHRWFAIPASTLAVAVAIHITDVQVELVRGLRTLGLTLLSWLLPLMTLIVAGFLVTLIFTGLQPLWDTRFATTLLLLACTALIVLINATYREGDAERAPSMMLRQPGRLAALMLLPLV
ncbi:MAG TPA: hypothetical protein VEU06_04775, partial [Micropepsaceae bacterium]|nr:hypothetical protein [Micropepsaceae bacterium]